MLTHSHHPTRPTTLHPQCVAPTRYEGQVEKLAGALWNLEQTVIATEGMVSNSHVVDALRTGANAMKSMSKAVNPDAVEDTIEELAELKADADEVSNLISQPMGGQMFDEDELLGELEEIEADAEREREGATIFKQAVSPVPSPQAAAPAPALAFPEVPSSAPSGMAFPAVPTGAIDEAELEELRQLEAMMA